MNNQVWNIQIFKIRLLIYNTIESQFKTMIYGAACDQLVLYVKV